MPSAATLRLQIESALAVRVPGALTPAPRTVRPVAEVGIVAVDALLAGGLPLGAITEMIGPECSGRTSMALSFMSRMTQTGKVCAWIDVSDALHPESAAAAGVDLARLLWVRCGVLPPANAPYGAASFALPDKYLVSKPVKPGLHSGGFGTHPRNEDKGLSEAVSGLLHPQAIAPRCAEPQSRLAVEKQPFIATSVPRTPLSRSPIVTGKPWSRLEQALRVTDLLLQAGGFSAIVLDMGGIAPECASRVPLATWFRYRAAAERSQASIILLTQHACAKSSAGLVLQLLPGNALREEPTVLSGVEYRVERTRERFAAAPPNVVPLRKSPQREQAAVWSGRTAWAGRR